MFKNLDQIKDTGLSSGWVNVYQVWDAAGSVVAKATAAECRRDWAGPQYQFSLLHEVRV